MEYQEKLRCHLRLIETNIRGDNVMFIKTVNFLEKDKMPDLNMAILL